MVFLFLALQRFIIPCRWPSTLAVPLQATFSLQFPIWAFPVFPSPYLWLQRWSQRWTDILYSQRWRSSIQSAKTRLGADCDSDHELLIAKFRLKLKKVGKTTRPFRYDLNQIPCGYTMELRNRFKRLDLTDRVPEVTMDRGLWHCTGDRDQDHPQEKEMQKGKNGCLRRP